MPRRYALAVPLAIVLALAAAALPGARTVRADGPTVISGSASLTLEAPAPGRTSESFTIAALLRGTDGQPLEQQRVDFFVDVDLPAAERGQQARPMLVGSATTDATGRARVEYRPTWDGTHAFSARSRGDGVSAAVDASMTFVVSGAATPYVEQSRALQPLREWMPLGSGALVLAVWAALAFITLRTVMGISRAGRQRGEMAARGWEPIGEQARAGRVGR